ncbi:DUF2235 domain-containing protein [Aquitalea sp. FJL05]|nr:DUF2235 domain-containing protein [Aquitalea sp. FJL05]RQO76005.1 DUF2235 domain-containing protein [Aquitalea sp. FJL05]
MTLICKDINQNYSNPCSRNVFFSADDEIKLRGWEARELPPICTPTASCDANLFFGFFFDGTRNNYNLCQSNDGFSNVARLYDCYPGRSVPGVITSETKWENVETDYPHFFKVYIPGVGTPFPQVKDSGQGRDAAMGAAMALYGHERIVWGLMQAINNVHFYFLGSALLQDAEILSLSRGMVITGWSLKDGNWITARQMENAQQNTFDKLRGVLKKLHAAIAPFMHAPGEKPANMSKGKVGSIHLSVFGFSRGATKARSFSNWMQRMCTLDAELTNQSGMTLGGFPVTFDFLGIFDTVASVGLAASTLLFDGHAEWADAEQSLRVPPGMPCVHLVSAHEIRRSFPLDSIETEAGLPAGCEEIMFPGVHSDIGGGYLPKEQGRGTDPKGSEKLSRITLAVMYRKARLAGVPLKAEKMPAAVQYRMQVDAKLIEDFNAFLEALPRKNPADKDKPVKYKDLLRDMYWPYVAWRLSWAGIQDRAALLERFPNLQAANNGDVNDLLGGNKKMAEHLGYFRSWMNKDQVSIGRTTRNYYPPTWDPKVVKDWAELVEIWPELSKGTDSKFLPPAVNRLFTDYVHDSYAWFRITGKESPEILAGLKELSEKKKANGRLTEEEEGWVKLYEDSQGTQVPQTVTEGQEPFLIGAGYLRYRKVYAGADSVLLTRLNQRNSPSTETAVA